MKAIVQTGFGPPEVLALRDVPTPTPGEGRVLVRVRAASVNALDSHMLHMPLLMRVALRMGVRAPKTPGRGADLAGVVEAVGPNVTRLKPGDEVFGGGVATFAEYAIAPERALALKPTQLSFEQAAAMGVAGITALQGLRDKGQVRPGDRVLVFGAGGGVGTFAVQIAKALGAHVTAVTGPRSIELVRTLGADETVDYTREDVTKRDERWDVIYDVAATCPLSDLRRVLAPNGRLVLAGAAKGHLLKLIGRLAAAEITRRAGDRRLISYIARMKSDDLATLATMVEAGTICPVIDRAFTLADAREAVRYVSSGQGRAKVVITVS